MILYKTWFFMIFTFFPIILVACLLRWRIDILKREKKWFLRLLSFLNHPMNTFLKNVEKCWPICFRRNHANDIKVSLPKGSTNTIKCVLSSPFLSLSKAIDLFQKVKQLAEDKPFQKQPLILTNELTMLFK